MKVIRDDRLEAFIAAVQELDEGGDRIKDVRATELVPGGRTRLTLFSQVGEQGRPHPRLQVSMPPSDDPASHPELFTPPGEAPSTAAAFEALLDAALLEQEKLLRGGDLDPKEAPAGSPLFWVNTIARSRTERFFYEAGSWLVDLQHDGVLKGEEAAAAMYALQARADHFACGLVSFDDSDTGTYHSFRHDAPFVHCLEAMRDSLPEPGGQAFVLLPPEQQEAVRRQRKQVTQHLDWLMRKKYAHSGVDERNIEQSVGGFLIDRETRLIVSETEESRDSLVPGFELLRIEPDSEHEHAGAWVYRDADGGLHLQDHSEVSGSPALRAVPKEAANLTFRRALKDPALRKGIRFDWDGDGYVAGEPIGWISWAGHCDIKAVVEQLGITLADEPSVTEYRSDTTRATLYDHDLLLEILTSVLELGSVYRKLDGSGRLMRGVHRFGGSRNDSRPDRLQFLGSKPGQSFRWPLAGGRKESFVITALEGDSGEEDLSRVFMRSLPDVEALDFAANPRFLKTIEGDYNLIDVSGFLVKAKLQVDVVDPSTGYLRQEAQETRLDLRPGAEPGRDFLGTHVQSAAEREIYKVWLDRNDMQIVAELFRWERGDSGWAASPVPEQTVRIDLVSPLECTASREMRLDDPLAFQELLGIAVKEGRNINADTDMAAEVWNGTVVSVQTERLAEDRSKRTEHWRVDLTARFGDATLEYLLRRSAQGEIEEFCPVPTARNKAPDFLWQDFPDVGSKGVEGSDWLVNESMVERGIVELEWDTSAPGGVYVYDDQVKNAFEILFAGLGGYPFTIVHQNKRWGFREEGAWAKACARLGKLRNGLGFED